MMFFHFRIGKDKILYPNVLHLSFKLFKPFRPKIVLELLANLAFNLLLNIADPFTVNLIMHNTQTYQEGIMLLYYIIYTELCNALNSAISKTMHESFRINLQLKKFDRVQKLFALAFPAFGINFVYCTILFCIRKVVF